MRRVLFDSDVLLDVLMERQPFAVASARALTWATIPGNEGMVAGHAVTNMFYILRCKVGREEAISLISAILQILKVASVTESVSGVPAILVKKQGDFLPFWQRDNSLIGSYQRVKTKNKGIL